MVRSVSRPYTAIFQLLTNCYLIRQTILHTNSFQHLLYCCQITKRDNPDWYDVLNSPDRLLNKIAKQWIFLRAYFNQIHQNTHMAFSQGEAVLTPVFQNCWFWFARLLKMHFWEKKGVLWKAEDLTIPKLPLLL